MNLAAGNFMCRFDTLYHDAAKGYVIKCSHCQKLQVAYGTIAITLEYGEFAQLLRLVRKFSSQKHPSEQGVQKNIFIPVSSVNTSLLFNDTELHEFCSILEKADDELKVLALLDLFYKK